MYELTCRIKEVSFDYFTGKPLVTLELNEGGTARSMVDELKSRDKLTLKIDEYKEKRSLNANAYYWKLLGQLAKKLKISNSYCHNVMLRRYGTIEEYDGRPVFVVIPDTDEAEKQADEAETYHIKPTTNVRVGNDGKLYRTYMLMKPSHKFSTAEMSRLIDGIIDECRQVGIQTMTPNEIAKMKDLWRQA